MDKENVVYEEIEEIFQDTKQTLGCSEEDSILYLNFVAALESLYDIHFPSKYFNSEFFSDRKKTAEIVRLLIRERN